MKHAPVEQGTQETQVLSLGREDPFEEMATCSSIVARKSHERISVWEGGRRQSMGSQSVRHVSTTECACARMHTHVHAHAHTRARARTINSPFRCATVFYVRKQGIEAMDLGTSNIFS